MGDKLEPSYMRHRWRTPPDARPESLDHNVLLIISQLMKKGQNNPAILRTLTIAKVYAIRAPRAFRMPASPGCLPLISRFPVRAHDPAPSRNTSGKHSIHNGSLISSFGKTNREALPVA